MKRKAKKTKMVKAVDDWFPNFAGDTVRVSLHYDSAVEFRVSVWGDDDYGMEKVFETESAAEDAYNQLTEASKSSLKKLGFSAA